MDLIKSNPMLKQPVLLLLALAEDLNDRAELEAAAQEAWQPSFTLTPTATIDVLVRNGALAETLYINGYAYDGTLEDAQFDPEVADDATAETLIELTQQGQALAAAYNPYATVKGLFDGKPAYRPVFQAVVEACTEATGATREALEAVVESFKPTKPDNPRQRVYPQYFLSALEEAGAIQWNGTWRATDAGRALMAG